MRNTSYRQQTGSANCWQKLHLQLQIPDASDDPETDTVDGDESGGWPVLGLTPKAMLESPTKNYTEDEHSSSVQSDQEKGAEAANGRGRGKDRGGKKARKRARGRGGGSGGGGSGGGQPQ